MQKKTKNEESLLATIIEKNIALMKNIAEIASLKAENKKLREKIISRSCTAICFSLVATVLLIALIFT